MPAEQRTGLVLLVEDEQPIAALQELYLTREGFRTRITGSGREGLELARSLHPVAIVLDIGLPDLDGVQICRTLRAEGDRTPVLFVTAHDEETDRVLGLELGGDDYITKPFSPRELVARVKAVLRRNAPSALLMAGEVTVDLDGHRVLAGDREVELTGTEFDLLCFLMRRPGRIFSRDQLLQQIWGYPSGSRTVDVHVAQLRSKLGESSPIRTVRGVGYGVDR
ncbi:MAG TPA: response regulator transcription factor [Mycobacteriales bacterium]|nr:response regulator transcription factor [Mycobacteriales bacterium]